MKDDGTLSALELFRARRKLLEQMDKLEDELNRRRAQDRHIMRAEELEWKGWSEIGVGQKGGDGRMADLIAPELGFNVYNLRATILEVPPGYDQGSYHSHGEGVKHYLKGEGGIEVIGDKEYSVKTGDTVFIPADTWHGTRNTGTDPILILVASYSELGVPLIRRVVRRNR